MQDDRPSELLDHLVHSILLLLEDSEVVHDDEFGLSQGGGVVQDHPSIVGDGDGIGELCACNPGELVAVWTGGVCAIAGRADGFRHLVGAADVTLLGEDVGCWDNVCEVAEVVFQERCG